MKICYVYCQPLKEMRKGYSEQHPLRLAAMLGDDAQVCVLYSGVIDTGLLKRHRITPYYMPSKLMRKGLFFQFLALTYYAYKMGKTYKFDVYLNVWDHYMALPLWLGGKFAGVKALASVGGVPIKKEFYRGKSLRLLLRKKMGLWMEKVSLRTVPFIHSVAYHLKKVYVSRGIREDKFTVISRGIDVSAFPNSLSSHSNRSKSSDFHIITVCHLTPQKGVETLIDAFELVSKSVPGLYLHIVGGGDHKQFLETLANQKQCKDRISFYGFLEHSDVVKIYSRMNFFVLPSLSEGIANVVMEAMLCGVPSAGTTVGDVPRHLGEGRGYLFEPNDVNALAEIISKAAQTPRDEFESMTQKAREYVIDNHSFHTVKQQYLDFFHRVKENG